MRQRAQVLAVLLFAMFVIFMSVACSSGGVTDTTLTIGGDWRLPYASKVDGIVTPYLYVKIADNGAVVPEPDTLSYPLTISGSFSLADPLARSYSGSFQYMASSSSGPFTVSGTLTVLSTTTGTFLESSKIDASSSGVSITRLGGIAAQAGNYIIDARRRLGETSEYIVEKVDVMHLAANGDFTLDADPTVVGVARLFRGVWFYGSQDIVEGETVVGDVQIIASLGVLKADSSSSEWGSGIYMVDSPSEEHEGLMSIYRATGLAYTMADFAHPWSAVHLDRGDGSVSQVTGIVIQSDGDIDPIPGTNVVGGTLTINNAATGKFTMSLNIDEDGDTHVTTMSGMISPSLAYGTTIEVDAETEEIISEIYMYRADMPGWNYSLREGWWCTSPTNRVTLTMEDDSTQDIPLSIMTGHCGSDGTFDILPDLGDTSVEASIIMLGANTYSIMTRVDSTEGSYIYWAVGTFLQPAAGTGSAFALVQADTGGQTGEGQETASMVRLVESNTPISYFTGAYTVTSMVSGLDVTNAVVAVSGSDLTFTFNSTVPVTYTTEWDETIPFMFRLYTMVGLTQVYLPGTFFLTPSEMSLFNGQFRFSDNQLLWGIMLAD